MRLIKKTKWRMITGIVIGIIVVLGVVGIAFINQPSFVESFAKRFGLDGLVRAFFLSASVVGKACAGRSGVLYGFSRIFCQ